LLNMSDRTFGVENLSFKNYDFPLEKIPALSWDKDRDAILDHIKGKVRLRTIVIERLLKSISTEVLHKKVGTA
jgi:hypothetical protein